MPKVIVPKSKIYDSSHWVAGVYVCGCPTCGKAEHLARLYGPFAVWRGHEEGGGALSHVHTHTEVVNCGDSEEGLMWAGDWLFRTIPLVLRLRTVDEMREALGNRATTFRKWAKRCEATKKFASPAEFGIG